MQATGRRKHLRLTASPLAATGGAAIVVALFVPTTEQDQEQLRLRDGTRVLLRLDPGELPDGPGARRAALRRAVARLGPEERVLRRGGLTVRLRLDADRTTRALMSREEGDVAPVRTATSSVATTPVVRQAQKNTCETAALSMVMAALGRPVDQTELQRALPTSGSLDPEVGPDGPVWGDPELGYVGRPDGGGAAGGFGVYPGPIRRLGMRLGVRLEDLSGASAREIVTRVRRGGVVLAWIGLSAGPYGEWRSPGGRRVRVNFGEHTVVLHGSRPDGRLLVANPLEGTRELWTSADFEERYERLERRALASPPLT
jgi:uncharacterized protein YvpB